MIIIISKRVHQQSALFALGCEPWTTLGLSKKFLEEQVLESASVGQTFPFYSPSSQNAYTS